MAVVMNEIPRTLEDKLALMVWYLDEIRNKRRHGDQRSFDAMLDDAEIQNWLHEMNRAGRIVNTRFTQSR